MRILIVAITLALSACDKPAEKTLDAPIPAEITTAAIDQLDQNNFAAVEELALHGNYQAQRNLAYGFASMPYVGQQKNPVLACAWYLVVINSGSPSINAGDQGNVEVYCGSLEPDLLEAAKYQATKFLSRVEQNTRLGKLN